MKSSYRLALAVLILLSVTLAFSNLGGPALWDESEAMYAAVARGIAVSGDFFTQTYNGQPWFVHPPLYAWLTNIVARGIGWSEATVRTGAAASEVGCVLMTVALGNALFGIPVGLIAGFIIATTLQLIISAHIGVYDTLLLFLTLTALWGLYEGLENGKQKYFGMAAASMGLATITKGPVGFVLPILISLPFSLIPQSEGGRRRFGIRHLKIGTLLIGSALFLAIVVPWYAVETARHGSAFTSYILGYQSFGRYFGVVEHQTGGWAYYLPLIPVGFLPWSGTLVGALPYLFALRKNRPAQFLIGWIGVTLFFFSLAQTKLINYILPLYPALAIVVAKLFADAEDARAQGWKRAAQITGGLLFAIVMGGALYYVVKNPPLVASSTALTLLGAPLLIMIFGGLGFALNAILAKGFPLKGFSVLVLGMGIGMYWIITISLPQIESIRPQTKGISEIAARSLPPRDPLLIYQLDRTASPVFYSGHPLLRFDDKEKLNKEIVARIKKNKPLLLLMDRKTYLEEFRDLPLGPKHLDGFLVLLGKR